MAVLTAPPKQTLHTPAALAAIGNAIHFRQHHTKPFRKRHVLILLVSLLFIGAMMLEIATVIARQTVDPRALFATGAVPEAVPQRTTVVRSSSGFSFAFDSQQFKPSVRSKTLNGYASDAELSNNNSLSSVILSPLPSYVPPAEAATELEVRIETDQAAFAVYKSSIKKRTDITELTANYFAPKPSTAAVITEELRTTEAIGGSLMTKSIYAVKPNFAGNPTRTIVWTAEVEGRPTALVIRGIIDGSNIPSTMAPVLKSMQFNTKTKVEGLSIFGKEPAVTIDQKYIADLVSPAIVKIYHVTCGNLVYKGNPLSNDTCNGTSGSGFIVSSDGYVATNGHVVVYGAKDMLANALLNNKALFAQFLSGSKFSQSQIQEVLTRPELTASVISKLYDLPDSDLKLTNQRTITVVATGKSPLKVDDEKEVKRFISSFESTENLRKATVVGYDYAAKDQLTLVADPDKGFSASDVALLKIEIKDAPLVGLATTPVTQNQTMTLFGFPGDADNQLTDNSKLDVSVTNGNISAIRNAAGSDSVLYQSDADASKGNSGGPAIDSDGKAFGILTYRYNSGQNADAAKSYIRAIDDFTDLMADKRVTLNTQSSTQDAWQRGIDLYSRKYYSKALIEFNTVKRLYPAHRLVDTYIDNSKQAVNDGKDTVDPPSMLLILGFGAGIGGIGASVILIARHHGRHQLYRAFHHHKPSLQV